MAARATAGAPLRKRDISRPECIDPAACNACTCASAFSTATALELWKQVAQGLGAIHDAEIQHLDMTPGNILLEGARDPEGAITEELLRTASKRFLSHMQTTLYRLTQQSEGGHGKPNEQVAELQAFATAALGTALRIMSSRR